jgi:hypothetical protein
MMVENAGREKIHTAYMIEPRSVRLLLISHTVRNKWYVAHIGKTVDMTKK